MAKDRTAITIKERPTRGKGGAWELRDTRTGQSTVVRSSAKSKVSISKSASANAALLERLAKR